MIERNAPWPNRLIALVYVFGILVMGGYALWHYLMGDYGRILLPAVLTLLMAGAVVLRLSNHHARYLSSYLALFSCYLLCAVELARLPGDPGLWSGLPPVLAILMLPLVPALLLNVLLAPVWLVLLGLELPDLDSLLTYAALVITGALAPWEKYRQRALDILTSPMDQECSALSTTAIVEQLHGEHQRAQLMGRPLSVLVIHLPQLKMAQEQFGVQLRGSLLECFCQVVRQVGRTQDRLGRTQASLFWLILPGTPAKGAEHLQYRLLDALNGMILVDTVAITANAGICTLRAGETSTSFETRLRIKEQHLLEART
ncbi:GGDEF domain-containing protein [Pistricoccus aurantiacus]|uniref:GGDEF domain-containing protein n=1 Tax=Pistricoccus aurantiacus TaxID=1883414 RepID=A0A5B8SUB3_9GAMM|nr:diguanylate cyclase [Pistricoccus aurantiacus]QEA40316.1 GGDEF domain-containing protein [Pistricoccus aurantiacus]